MSYNGFPRYISKAEKEEKARKSLEKLKKKNGDITPVTVTGGNLANTWWGRAWNANLESYSDYANRIDRGRAYVRSGAVLDLKIQGGRINALVQGSRAAPYEIGIDIGPLGSETWEEIIRSCEGKLESLRELLEGKFPKALADLFTARGKGLFPSPREISFECSCPDWASMCKHVAATLYGTGVRLDEDPSLFFVLRGVDVDELVAKAVANESDVLLGKSDVKSTRIIGDADLSGLFGIELEDGTGATE